MMRIKIDVYHNSNLNCSHHPQLDNHKIKIFRVFEISTLERFKVGVKCRGAYLMGAAMASSQVIDGVKIVAIFFW